ncbi:MAG: hypothetical protein HYU77_12775 [Betaproteobacteria bacterium]|nr:hypothetical protein [Betaproteobacteria bacterium]
MDLFFSDVRDKYISRVIKGNTFADIGGLWGTVNEKVSVAHKYGASDLNMMDIQPPESDLWHRFRERMVALGVTGCRCVTMDLGNPQIGSTVQPVDVVHCSGVLYHHPDPMLLLANLRRVSRKYVILTSAIIRNEIKNRKGRYSLPPSSVLFVPALSDAEREIMKAHWEPYGTAYGLTQKYDFAVDDFAPWWWLPTATALLAMCTAAGFSVEDSAHTWNDNALTVLLRCPAGQ